MVDYYFKPDYDFRVSSLNGHNLADTVQDSRQKLEQVVAETLFNFQPNIKREHIRLKDAMIAKNGYGKKIKKDEYYMKLQYDPTPDNDLLIQQQKAEGFKPKPAIPQNLGDVLIRVEDGMLFASLVFYEGSLIKPRYVKTETPTEEAEERFVFEVDRSIEDAIIQNLTKSLSWTLHKK